MVNDFDPTDRDNAQRAERQAMTAPVIYIREDDDTDHAGTWCDVPDGGIPYVPQAAIAAEITEAFDAVILAIMEHNMRYGINDGRNDLTDEISAMKGKQWPKTAKTKSAANLWR